MPSHKLKTHMRAKSGHRKPAEMFMASMLRKIYQDKNGPVLIAIGGPGGTGKSMFTKKLAKLLDDSAIFTLDDYKTPRSIRQDRNLFGAHPDANDMTLIHEHLKNISQGKTFEKPVYNNITGKADQTKSYQPKKYNLLDGEISTYKQFREVINFSIFIDSDWTTQLKTRISRDIKERKYTKEKVIATFLESNLREFQNYGAESKAWADVHLYCRDDYHLVVESLDEDIYHRFEALLDEELAAVDLSGLIVPLTTPFDQDHKIDPTAFINHLEFLADHGIQRILVAGSTGEFFSLVPDERKQLLSLARRYFPGMVLFQAGTESLALTRQQIEWADDFGADAILVLPPYYYANVTAEGLINYFQTLSQNTDLPFILYNFPQNTNLPLTPELLSNISHFGLKDSSGNPDLISATPRYYMGGDAHIMTAFQKGAYGFLSPRANFFPELYVNMETAVRDKDWKTAANLQDRINQIHQKVRGRDLIQMVKALIATILPDYPVDVRLPLVMLSDAYELELTSSLTPLSAWSNG